MKLKHANRKISSARRDSAQESPRNKPSLAPTNPSSRSLAKSMLDGAVTLTPSGTILQSNLSFAEMMAMPFDEVIGKSFFAFVQIGWNQRFFDLLQGSVAKSQTAEVSLITRKGEEIFARLDCTPFTLDSEKAVTLTISNLKVRKAMEDALVRSTQRLETAAGLNSNAVWELDLATKEIWRSQGFASLLGYPDDVVKPTPMWWRQAIHPEDRSPVFSALERLVKKGDGFQQSYRIRKFDGSYAEVVDRAVVVHDDKSNTLRVIGSIADVTDENRAQAAKKELAKRILRAQEEERQRVARDLHDGVSQLLASGSYRLHHVENQIADQDKALAERVLEVRELIERARQELQLISQNLRPSELDDLGLSAALRTLCAEFQKRSGIKTILRVENVNSLAPEIELTIYRICQEALNNTEKHAAARKVQIILKRDSNMVLLTIHDDGKGFEPNEMKKNSKSGWGLENMRQRAACFSGTVSVASGVQRGTKVIVMIPGN